MRGLIDGFNMSRRKISTGVGETAAELMSSIRFWTTPKFDLSHYSFIFRNPEPLGTELNNAACYRLGTRLYLYIHKWKEAMKASYFVQKIGGTAAYMKLIMKATKGCG